MVFSPEHIRIISILINFWHTWSRCTSHQRLKNWRFSSTLDTRNNVLFGTPFLFRIIAFTLGKIQRETANNCCCWLVVKTKSLALNIFWNITNFQLGFFLLHDQMTFYNFKIAFSKSMYKMSGSFFSHLTREGGGQLFLFHWGWVVLFSFQTNTRKLTFFTQILTNSHSQSEPNHYHRLVPSWF